MDTSTVTLERFEYDELVEYRLRMQMIRNVLLEPCTYADNTLDFTRRIAGVRGGEDD